METKKAMLMLFSSLLVLTLGLSFVAGVVGESQKRVVGVHVGDWAKYGKFLATWKSNDPVSQKPPFDLVEHNNTEWVTNTVKIINDTEITFQTVTHYKNGTETTSFSDIDINTGDGNGLFAFISANLNEFDSVYNSSDYVNAWINETTPLIYADALRETNYVNATTYEYVPAEIEQYLSYNVEYFWDKTTGMLTERAGTFVNVTGGYSSASVRSDLLIGTNVWQANPDTAPPIAEAGPDQTVTVGQIVSFDAENSNDNQGGWGIASYEWDFGDGAEGEGIETTHAFKKLGRFVVTLTVTDWAGNNDTDTLYVTVTVQESTPFPLGLVILIPIALFVAGLFFWKRAHAPKLRRRKHSKTLNTHWPNIDS